MSLTCTSGNSIEHIAALRVVFLVSLCAHRVPHQDNGAWVRACSELLGAGPMWEMIRTRQRAQLESEFAAKVVAARYEDLYQQLLDQR